MSSLSVDELNFIEKYLIYEKTMVAKYKSCYYLCKDPQLKQLCEQIAAKHQDHYLKLLNSLS